MVEKFGMESSEILKASSGGSRADRSGDEADPGEGHGVMVFLLAAVVSRKTKDAPRDKFAGRSFAEAPNAEPSEPQMIRMMK